MGVRTEEKFRKHIRPTNRHEDHVFLVNLETLGLSSISHPRSSVAICLATEVMYDNTSLQVMTVKSEMMMMTSTEVSILR